MMKKRLLLLVAALGLMSLLSACQSGGEATPTEAPHKHTFATAWSYDEDSHWYAANCGHEMQANLGSHTDEDNDGICDICLWDHDHEHTFTEEWAHDETHHWHDSDCGHSVVQDKAAHADENNDGVCDGCAWNYDHEHTYGTEWSHDAENHFHAATCGHDVEVKDLAPHADENNDGICDGCAWDYDHEHTFASEWSHDTDNHWKAATCGHAVISEEGAHGDEDNDGICDGCAWNYDHEHTYETGDQWTINDTHHWHSPICGHDVEGIDKTEHVDADENEACDVCGYDYNHEHTFDTTRWAWDKKVHYHASTCGHAVRADEEAHKDGNNDGICDVCTWNYDHTHTFSEEWSHDKTNHWHPASCGHNVKQDVAVHVDENNDKCCDVCLWDYDHTHTYATQWSIGTNTHYHAPTCGCNPEYVRGEEVAHEDKNRDDKCDTCGGYMSMEVVVDMAADPTVASRIKGGSIDLTYPSSGYHGEVTYEFGDGYLYIMDHQTYGSFDNTYEYWYSQGEDGTILAIAQEGGEPYRNMGAEAAFMRGYYFTGEFISYAFNCYGAEDLLYQLYGMHLSTDYTTSAYKEFYDQKNDTYSFSFIYGSEITVTFKINQGGALTYLKVVVGANEILIHQTAGERDAVNPYDLDVVLIKSYDIMDDKGNIIRDGDTIHMATGSDHKLVLHTANVTPSTVIYAFDEVRISCNDEAAVLSYSGTDGNMIVNAQKEGTYTVTFATERTTKTITIVVTYPAPTSMKPQVYDAQGGYEQYSECTMFIGDVLHFVAGVAYQTDGRYTAEITQNGANASLEAATIEVAHVMTPVTAFKPNQLGDYVITLTSVADPSLTCTLLVHVVEPIQICDVLNGTWKNAIWTLVFTPESIDATKGTVTIKKVTGQTAVFTYEYLTDGIQLTYVSGDENLSVKLSIDPDFRVMVGRTSLSRP